MRIWTMIGTTNSERAHLEEISDGDFVTSYGIDLEVPVDDDHPYGRMTILRQSFIMPDQDKTEEELEQDIEQTYVQLDLFENSKIGEREKLATWRLPLDFNVQTQLPPTEIRPNAMYPTLLEIEVKQFKMSTMKDK